MKLVIHPAIDAERLARVREAAGDMLVANCDSSEQATREIAEADAFFGKLTPELLAASSKLRWVQSPTASLEHFLFPELVEHPCLLSNMRGIFNDVIADHVMSYILCFARNLHIYLRQQQRAEWAPVGGEEARTTFASGPGQVSSIDRAHLHLAGCTVGVIGLGGIGGEVVRRAHAFGMESVAVDPVDKPRPPGLQALWGLDQLDRLLGESDFVVIAAPHTPQTEGWIGREQLRQMRPTAYLINVGRGVIVELDDLCQALRDGRIAGAALDVYQQEPLPADHPLWKMPNVILTPHIAAASTEIAGRHTEVLLENIRRFVRNQPPANLADKRNWF